MAAPVAELLGELRRLAVAGTDLARDDFRLKKLVPVLAEAGKKAPVLLKLSQAVARLADPLVPDGGERVAAWLETTALARAVARAQASANVPGDFAPPPPPDDPATLAELLSRPQASYKTLAPVIKALSEKGSGRGETLRAAQNDGTLRDPRLGGLIYAALAEPNPEVAALALEALSVDGRRYLPALRADFDPTGKTAVQEYRLQLIVAFTGPDGEAVARRAFEEGSERIRVAALAALAALPDTIDCFEAGLRDKRTAVARAAMEAMAGDGTGGLRDRLVATLSERLDYLDTPEARSALDRIAAPKSSDTNDYSKNDPYARNDPATPSGAFAFVLLALHCFNRLREPAAAIQPLLPRIHRLTLAYPDFTKHLGTFHLRAASFEGIVDTALDRWDGPEVVDILIERIGDPATVDPRWLSQPARSLRRRLPPARFYELFLPYLAPKPKSGGRGAERERAAALFLATDEVLEKSRAYEPLSDLDPRWMEHFVKMGRLGLVAAHAKPGMKAAREYLENALAAMLAERAERKDNLTVAEAMETLAAGLVRVGAEAALEPLLERLETDLIPSLLRSKSATSDRRMDSVQWLAWLPEEGTALVARLAARPENRTEDSRARLRRLAGHMRSALASRLYEDREMDWDQAMEQATALLQPIADLLKEAEEE